ncbi:hypothetical protein [Streptomyces lydicus]|uniref:hypothetical protein n=1 Tax=Streptomyces lydicus TaxID=47763 RepID=UPI0013DE2361|nr:hypothetical protein [Streptomyces lydicus]
MRCPCSEPALPPPRRPQPSPSPAPLVIASLPGAAALVLQAAPPQNSKDRLEWWRDRRRHRGHLARTRQPLPAVPDERRE